MKLAKYIFTFLIFFNSLLICQELQYNVINLDSLGTLKNIKVLDDRNIYLSTDKGLYKSTNEGTTWKQLVSGGVLSFDIDRDSVIITSESNRDWASAIYTNEIVRRKEKGDSLQVIDRYLLGKKYDNVPSANLIKAFNSSIYAAIGHQVNPHEYYADIIMRDSASNTWSKILQIVPNAYGGWGYIWDILPLSKDTIIISMHSNVQTVEITYDMGKNWKALGGYGNEGGFNSWILSVIVAPINTIMYANKDYGIFRSTDFGSSWHSWSKTFTKSGVFKLLKNGYPPKFFAITADSVYLSLNQGLTWASVPSDKQFTSLIDACITTDGNIYLISGNSLYIPTSVVGIVKDEGPLFPAAFNLMQNYPNPFNPTTTINYSIPKESFVTIKVYDVLGREIETLVREEKVSGSYRIKFDGSKFASGIYFYKITAGSFVQTKKMILMK